MPVIGCVIVKCPRSDCTKQYKNVPYQKTKPSKLAQYFPGENHLISVQNLSKIPAFSSEVLRNSFEHTKFPYNCLQKKRIKVDEFQF